MVRAQPSPALIRVAVSRDNPQVMLQIHGRFRMTALQTGTEIRQGRRLPSVAVRAIPKGLALGEAVIPYLGVRIEPASDAAISLNGRRLRGTLEIVRQQDLTLLVVNHVALEDYLRGVLSKEAPDYWPEEALKAIAIAARTYALYQRFTKEANLYDVTSDVMSQDYGGKTAEKRGTTRAVKATADVILLYRNVAAQHVSEETDVSSAARASVPMPRLQAEHGYTLFPTFYHSTCGGMTEHARVMGRYDLEPIRGGVACPLCSASPFYTWQRRLTKADVAWALRNSSYGPIGAIRDMQVTKRTDAGRAEEVTISGALRTLRLSGFDVRSLFGFERIRSPLFSILPSDDAFLIDGHGWGHGVGLCQWGAAELARRGFSAREILAFYYPHTDLVQVQDLANQPITVLDGS